MFDLIESYKEPVKRIEGKSSIIETGLILNAGIFSMLNEQTQRTIMESILYQLRDLIDTQVGVVVRFEATEDETRVKLIFEEIYEELETTHVLH